ncbi:uromodulin-like [Pocillopora verrucosa]|uniref:uromodulin-like n=1 Tax=Pocillopora verrucosa TaxID=203993 RepID=UPI00333EACC0
MEFSAFLIFAVWTSSMIYLTFGEERERAMVFPDYYFFAERRLANHTIETRKVKNFDDCELLCYLNDNCVSLNFKKDPDNIDAVHICELNNATHLTYDSDLTTDAKFYYRGSKNACDKNSHCQNNATCQSGFTLKGYRCLCPLGFEGERCEIDVDECKGNHSCHENANCTNTMGSHECNCQLGYTGNGQNCTDIDECSEAHTVKMNKCHPNASCTNTQGSYNCSCHPKYIGDGLNCEVDPCYEYKNLSHPKRKSSYNTPDHVERCETEFDGWYRFAGAAGTKMPTTRVPAYRCDTTFSGWLNGAHPTVEDGEVLRKVCFSDNSEGCKSKTSISVKNCSSYYIYKLHKPSVCPSRYCGTD